MKKCLVLDTSVGSDNKGDDIINECFQSELNDILSKCFVYHLPTHVSSFHWYQVMRNSLAVQRYANCDLKLIAGTNLLVKNMLTHYPQWNINLWNYKPFAGSVLVGVGAGAGEKTNGYTRRLYRKVLSHNFIHSVRDERTREFVESLGLKALNTGCVTMWCLTPEFCSEIPTKKASKVIFTLTARGDIDPRDQKLIDTLVAKYKEVYFWVQGDQDFKYLTKFKNTDNIVIVPPTIADYHRVLTLDDIDYVGTRLHAGIYAMRHKKRAIIIAIDERAREINKSNNLNCIEKDDIENLASMIDSEFATEIHMPFDKINAWKSQFDNFM